MKRTDIKPLPSQEVLLRLLIYDAENGTLTWRRQEGEGRSIFGFNNKCAGKVAGTVSPKSKYFVIGIRPKPYALPIYYLSHRLIWKMVTGSDPEDQIDHRDGNKQNNRWDNFRPANNVTNLYNSKLRIDSTSGFKGVHLRQTGNYRSWRAVITANGVVHRLGHFKTAKEASAARNRAASKLHGDFARSE